jgi:hemoglobin-like flavoprotein
MNAMLQPASSPSASPSKPDWLSPTEIELIRAQFARIGEDADGFAIEFYDALFAIAPLVRAMFRGPMPDQRAKLVRMLALLVSQLRSPEALAIPLAELGRRHHGYGVIPQDYGKVGEALLRTLGSRLGEDFDADARAAWGRLYGFVAARMQAAR